MSEPPALSEKQDAFSNNENEIAFVAKSTENQAPKSIENSTPIQPEVPAGLKRIEDQSTQQTEPEVAFPPVLQKTQTTPAEIVKPISQEYIQKGAKISSLTHIALETFRELQRKLALHYQKMKERTSS